MKTRMVEERIGEYLGPVDWAYDFTQHNWGDGHGGLNPQTTEQSLALFRELERLVNDGHECDVMMHQNWLRVLKVGMYDGWPFWQPTPSVLTYHVLGYEWSPWYNVQAVESKS